MSGKEKSFMHNTSYWSNNFDPRWQNSNSTRRSNFRGNKDWYYNQYSEKNRNHNNFNNHYNRRSNNSRGYYNNSNNYNQNQDSNRKSLNNSPDSAVKSKSSNSSADLKKIDLNIKENGLPNKDLKKSENEPSIKEVISKNEKASSTLNNSSSSSSSEKSDEKLSTLCNGDALESEVVSDGCKFSKTNNVDGKSSPCTETANKTVDEPKDTCQASRHEIDIEPTEKLDDSLTEKTEENTEISPIKSDEKLDMEDDNKTEKCDDKESSSEETKSKESSNIENVENDNDKDKNEETENVEHITEINENEESNDGEKETEKIMDVANTLEKSKDEESMDVDTTGEEESTGVENMAEENMEDESKNMETTNETVQVEQEEINSKCDNTVDESLELEQDEVSDKFDNRLLAEIAKNIEDINTKTTNESTDKSDSEGSQKQVENSECDIIDKEENLKTSEEKKEIIEEKSLLNENQEEDSLISENSEDQVTATKEENLEDENSKDVTENILNDDENSIESTTEIKYIEMEVMDVDIDSSSENDKKEIDYIETEVLDIKDLEKQEQDSSSENDKKEIDYIETEVLDIKDLEKQEPSFKTESESKNDEIEKCDLIENKDESVDEDISKNIDEILERLDAKDETKLTPIEKVSEDKEQIVERLELDDKDGTMKISQVKLSEIESATSINESSLNIIEEVDLIDDDDLNITASKSSMDIDESSMQSGMTSFTDSQSPCKKDLLTPSKDIKQLDAVKESSPTQKRKSRKRNMTLWTEIAGDDNNVRQKRRSAKNAQEIVQGILKDSQKSESSDDEKDLIPYKKHHISNLQALSPSKLKRHIEDAEFTTDSVTIKKVKPNNEIKTSHAPIIKENNEAARKLVREISKQDIRSKLKKLTTQELEALLIQKIIETMTIREDIGILRDHAKASKRCLEATRARCQLLAKQVEGYEMVLKRIQQDKHSNNDKYVPPIKINRSVGLQVNFISNENGGMANLRQVKNKANNNNNNANVNTSVNSNTSSNASSNANSNANSKVASPVTPQPKELPRELPAVVQPKKGIKVRHPRRSELPSQQPASPQTTVQPPAVSTTNTISNSPVINNHNEPKRMIIQAPAPQGTIKVLPPIQRQNIVVQTPNTQGRQPTFAIQRAAAQASKSNDLIDLTDESEKLKVPASVQQLISNAILDNTSGKNSRYPRVLQAQLANVPQNVITSQTHNIRLVQTPIQTTQATIMNSIVQNGSPRLAYVMPNGKQYVLTGPNPIRPTNISGRIQYRPGVPHLTGGTVRVITTQPSTSITQLKHPAPLPESPSNEQNPAWKLPPPAPSLKISKVTSGIVLSWNMPLSDRYADIASYQLFAYQEINGTPPSTTLWKKVGDVRALPLPMACTLTQFSEGNNYHFAVRAVDAHSRFGHYSKPGHISL